MQFVYPYHVIPLVAALLPPLQLSNALLLAYHGIVKRTELILPLQAKDIPTLVGGDVPPCLAWLV